MITIHPLRRPFYPDFPIRRKPLHPMPPASPRLRKDSSLQSTTLRLSSTGQLLQPPRRIVPDCLGQLNFLPSPMGLPPLISCVTVTWPSSGLHNSLLGDCHMPILVPQVSSFQLVFQSNLRDVFHPRIPGVFQTQAISTTAGLKDYDLFDHPRFSNRPSDYLTIGL